MTRIFFASSFIKCQAFFTFRGKKYSKTLGLKLGYAFTCYNGCGQRDKNNL